MIHLKQLTVRKSLPGRLKRGQLSLGLVIQVLRRVQLLLFTRSLLLWAVTKTQIPEVQGLLTPLFSFEPSSSTRFLRTSGGGLGGGISGGFLTLIGKCSKVLSLYRFNHLCHAAWDDRLGTVLHTETSDIDPLVSNNNHVVVTEVWSPISNGQLALGGNCCSLGSVDGIILNQAHSSPQNRTVSPCGFDDGSWVERGRRGSALGCWQTERTGSQLDCPLSGEILQHRNKTDACMELRGETARKKKEKPWNVKGEYDQDESRAALMEEEGKMKRVLAALSLSDTH
ncbi:hypothetical protein FQN60_010861 [Etheostoma spectabile]|uniref:Uncharacterized protein n=1 Tax=Etheostoma spectabile TaxID=54343 RepID=A0A5J5DQK2_9PERO|nr:hypothetical protein FQN60_010861 [Etheostoma spectabile]